MLIDRDPGDWRAHIGSMSYPEFVAFIGIQNTPPGGLITLNIWRLLGAVIQSSHVLDLACSSGFSSRELNRLTNCTTVGMDICYPAIAEARRQAKNDRVTYLVGDATSLPFKSESFSHVVAGCALGFIRERDAAISEAVRVLKPSGRLLVSVLHYVTPPPSDLLDNVASCIGYRPDGRRTLDYWRGLFSEDFILESDVALQMSSLTGDEVRATLHGLVFNQQGQISQLGQAINELCFDRFLRIRLVLAEHQTYQRCRLLILRVRK